MVKAICKDLEVLKIKAEKAGIADKYIADELLATLRANKDICAGMAANMIGYPKAIIAINYGIGQFVMYNPRIIKKNKAYRTQEGCLSLKGVRKALRYKEIEVEFEDGNFVKHQEKYTDFLAQIIQHECDHLEGIII